MILEKIKLDKEHSDLLLKVFSKHSLEKGKLYSFELIDGQDINIILSSETIQGTNINYVGLSDEDIRKNLKKKIVKDDDPFGPCIPDEDWEVYK